jgi:hypothetical protein
MMKPPIHQRLAVAALVIALAVPAAAQDPSRDFGQLASSLAPGTRIELDLADGTHIEGTVLAQEEGRFVFNPKTRLPVTPWRIEYSEIRSPEQTTRGDGMRPGTKVLLGIGVGAAVWMVLVGIALASLD